MGCEADGDDRAKKDEEEEFGDDSDEDDVDEGESISLQSNWSWKLNDAQMNSLRLIRRISLTLDGGREA